MSLRPLYTSGELKESTRLYEQTLCQSHYTHLSYSILTIYKFLLPAAVVPQVKRVAFYAFPLSKSKKAARMRHRLFVHFLFLFFHKDLGRVALQTGSLHWQILLRRAGLGFYQLRYDIWPDFNIYPFVPGPQWHRCNPRDQFRLDFQTFVEEDDEFFLLKPQLETHMLIEYEEEHRYRLGGQLRCEIPATLPAWYGKVFALRALHYPVTYNNRALLRPLEMFRQVPLKQPFLFDAAEDVEYSARRYKQKLYGLYRTLLNWRRVLTEYTIAYRLAEQLRLPARVRKAAAAFRQVWRTARPTPAVRRRRRAAR